MWIGLPSTAWAASIRASLRVGWAWTLRAISSAVSSVIARQGQFRQQFRHVRADHVRPQNLAIFGVGDDFDKAIPFTQTQRLAVGWKGNWPTLIS
jgi:hypothetical protein